MTARAVRVVFALAFAALVASGEGYVVSAGSSALVAQRGGRGFGARGRRGQPSAGVRTIVKGRVASVDPTDGRITLTIGGTSVKVEFPPAVVQGAKPGDEVMVTVELIDTRVGAVTGPVTSVNRASGAVTVNLPGGPWTNTFLPADIVGVQPGDQAVLKLDLVDLGSPILPPSLLPGPSQPDREGNGTR